MNAKQLTCLCGFILILFISGCEEGLVNTQDSKIETRGKNNNGKGKPGGQGGNNQLYEVVFNGSIISSTISYGEEVTNNKKYDLMHTDACDKFFISGVPDLVSCTSHLNFCVDGVGLRQFDKRRDPGHVSFSLWVLIDPTGNHNLRMFGWLQNGATTLFPESGSVSIIFDRWTSSGPSNCPDDEGVFATDPPEASVIITRIETGCPGSDTCP